MKMIRPTAMTDAVVLSSTVPETDYPAWSAATGYSVGANVIRTTPNIHRIYQCLVANTGQAPELFTSGTTPKWLDMGPTNTWGMFDPQVGTATTAAGSLTVTFQPGFIDSIGLLQLVGDSVHVTMTNTVSGVTTTVFDKTYSLIYGGAVVDWYAYFFGPINKITDLVISGLPPYTNGIVTITISAASGNVSCGMCVAGQSFLLGTTQFGATVSIVDYSRKDIDAFGNPTLIKRRFAKKMDAKINVDAAIADLVVNTTAAWRSTPVLWVGADNLYTCLIVFGFYREFSNEIAYPTKHVYTISIEGMI